MTLQKKTSTKRNIEQPNWVEEVKPSEDVMALFYAPTGLPKAGALSPFFPINSNELTNTVVPVVNNQTLTDYEKTNLASDQYAQQVKAKETLSSTTNKIEKPYDRDHFVDLDQKDQNLDQKDSKNIRYRNPTPYRSDTVSDSDTVSKSDRVLNNDTRLNKSLSTKLDLSKGFIAIPTHLLDELAKTLTPTEWTLYLRLFRLSYGWHKDTCIVGLESLVEATNISRTVLRETLKSLQARKLIQVIETINTKELKGTKYRVYTLSENDTLSKSARVSENDTVSSSDTNKYNDDDDSLNKDHHQKNKPANLTEHEKSVMMIYQKTTGNSWTKADSENYEKIKDIAIEKIELAIRLASQRATNRPNSLAYFIKEILSVSSPTKQSRSQQKKAMEKIIKSVSNSLIGKSYSISELADYVKEACIKDDVPFDHDLFNDLIAKK